MVPSASKPFQMLRLKLGSGIEPFTPSAKLLSLLLLQAGLPSPPKTYKPMMKGVYVAYAVVAW